MKRIVLLVGLLLLASGLVATAVPFFLSTDTIRGAVKTQLQQLTGRTVEFSGNPALRFNPFLSLEVRNLTISGADAGEEAMPLLQVDRVQGKIDFLQSLLGKVELQQYMLVRPRLDLRTWEDGTSNWAFTGGSIHNALEGARKAILDEGEYSSIGDVPLGVINFEDGIIVHENRQTGKRTELTAVSGTLDWASAKGEASLSGAAIWNGENFKLDVSVDEALKLLGGGVSETELTLESTPANVQFSGSANMISDLFIKGDLELATPTTERLERLMGRRLGKLGAVTVKGAVEASQQMVRLTDAFVEIAGNQSNGFLNVSFAEGKKSKLTGTLAFDDLDLSELLMIAGEDAPEEANEFEPKTTDVDLRVSSASVNVGFLQISDVAAIVSADDQGWTLDVGQSTIFSGNLIGKFGERYDGKTKRGFVEANGSGIETQDLFAFFGGQKISFSGLANITLSARSQDFVSLLARKQVDGKLEAKFLDGAIEGIDLNQLLQEVGETGTTSRGGLESSDRTEFDQASVSVFVTNSIGTIGQAEVLNGDEKIQISGGVGLSEGSLTLRAQQITETGPEPDRLFIGGTLQTPLVFVEPKHKSEVIPASPTVDTTIAN